MKTVYINFYATINEVSANKFMAACAQIVQDPNIKAEHLYFLFASPGGNVDSGIVIYNFLRSLPVKITMHNTGAIDSIANVIFHAADERFAAAHATFHFHGVALELAEKSKLQMIQVQEFSSQLAALEGKIANILVDRCGLSLPDLKELFLHGESKDTAFALDKGIIKAVSQPLIPPNSQFYSLSFV